MKLKKLLSSIEYSLISGNDETEISNIAYDSRKVSNGSVFVCIKGLKSDGHKFIESAILKGAKAIIVQETVNINNPDATIVQVKDTRKALAAVSSEIYGRPSEKLKLIGVTGTNGKTTTTYMMKAILETYHKKLGVIGTIGNMIGEKVLHTERTTPESLELQELFNEMVLENVDYAAMEVSSHALDLDRVYGCTYEIGIFTNLTQDHLDYHKTMEAYAKAKSKLFEISKNSVINIDSDYADVMVKASKGEVITVGINNKADVYAKNIEISIKGVKYHLCTPIGEADVFIKIPGKFTVYNSLGCIGACVALGMSFEDILSGIQKVNGVCGRFELVDTDTDYSVIVDYAHTPDGLENILNTAKEFTKGKIITVFGCGGDRDRTKRPIMGKIAASISDFCVITSDNPRTEEPDFIISEIIPGVLEAKKPYKAITDRKQAIIYALSMAEKDDVVIIAGKGHENYQILKNETIHFDDKEVVLEYEGGKK